MRRYGVKFFKAAENGGVPIDYVASEFSGNLLPHDAGANELVDALLGNCPVETLFQQDFEVTPEGNAIAPGETAPKIARVVTVNPAVIPVDTNDIPALREWVNSVFKDNEQVTIQSNGRLAFVSESGVRASLKKRGDAHNKAYAGLRELIENAIYDGFVEADERHLDLAGQEVYYSAARIGDQAYSVKLKFDKPKAPKREKNRTPRHGGVSYKDHKLSEIEIAPTLYIAPSNRKAVDASQPSVDAITGISLSVLKGDVKPSRIENTFIPCRLPPPLPHIAASSSCREHRFFVDAWRAVRDKWEKGAYICGNYYL